MDLPSRKIAVSEIKYIILIRINIINCWHNLTRTVGKMFGSLRNIFNVIILICCFSSTWKITQTIMMLKQGKILNKSHRIELQLCCQNRQNYLKKYMQLNQNQLGTDEILIIPNYSFGQYRYCSVAFPEVNRIFEKVWHLDCPLKQREISLILLLLKSNLMLLINTSLLNTKTNIRFYIQSSLEYLKAAPQDPTCTYHIQEVNPLNMLQHLQTTF